MRESGRWLSIEQASSVESHFSCSVSHPMIILPTRRKMDQRNCFVSIHSFSAGGERLKAMGGKVGDGSESRKPPAVSRH